MSEEFSQEEYLDARGWACPLPLLKTKQRLRKMDPGTILKLLATDPSTPKDMEVLLGKTKDELLSFSKEEEVFCFYIKKG